jgi:nicotinate-nucleotide adenylyltransferase
MLERADDGWHDDRPKEECGVVGVFRPGGEAALYGGSFDPPHVGHLLAMAYVLGAARVDGLLMVPCFLHRFEKRLAPFDERMEMARRCAEVLGPRVEVSDIEGRIGGESRTLTTVKALLAERPGSEISVVIGADLLAERERWFGYEELARIAGFFVVGRAHYADHADGHVLVPIPDVSSTEIRARVRRGETIEGLVPSAVADHIAARGLYRESP